MAGVGGERRRKAVRYDENHVKAVLDIPYHNDKRLIKMV